MARRYGKDPILHARALRALENMRVHTHNQVLDRARERGEPLILGMADGKQIKVTIEAVETKSFTCSEGSFPKLDVLYALPPKSAKSFKRAVSRDPALAARGLKLSPNPKERLNVSKMVFQRLIDESLVARYTFIDGTTISCRTRTFGFFEVNAEVKGGGEVTLFRHGLHRIAVGEEVLVDIERGFHVQGR